MPLSRKHPGVCGKVNSWLRLPTLLYCLTGSLSCNCSGGTTCQLGSKSPAEAFSTPPNIIGNKSTPDQVVVRKHLLDTEGQGKCDGQREAFRQGHHKDCNAGNEVIEVRLMTKDSGHSFGSIAVIHCYISTSGECTLGVHQVYIRCISGVHQVWLTDLDVRKVGQVRMCLQLLLYESSAIDCEYQPCSCRPHRPDPLREDLQLPGQEGAFTHGGHPKPGVYGPRRSCHDTAVAGFLGQAPSRASRV